MTFTILIIFFMIIISNETHIYENFNDKDHLMINDK